MSNKYRLAFNNIRIIRFGLRTNRDIDRQSPTTHPAAVNCYGFSLLEIIIVMLIVGMMAAIIAPSVQSGMDSMHFRTSIKRLLATLRYCRSRAISTKKNKIFEIDMDNGTYKTLAENLPGDEESKGSLTGKLPEGAIFSEWSTTYESETDAIQNIIFFPKGNATGGILRIENKRGKLTEIKIDRITGRVKVINLNE